METGKSKMVLKLVEINICTPLVTNNDKMILKVGDIVETYGDGYKFRILDITETVITYMYYYENKKSSIDIYDRKSFESVEWKPATLRWY